MAPPLLLAIDVGTQSVRVGLVDPAGRLEAVAGRPHEQTVPQPGWTQQDPEAWWAGVRSALGEVLAAVPGATGRLVAIGCCGQMHGPVPVAADGRCLTDAVQLWNCKRAAEAVAAFAARPDADALAAHAANPPSPAWVGFKAAWMRRHQPAIYEAARWLLVPKDFVNFRLTGEAATDFSEASGSFLLDASTRAYHPALADALGIDLGKLAAPVRSDAVIGRVTRAAAAATGLPAGLPVVAGGGDFLVSLLGSGVVGPGQGSDITGTSNLLSLNAPAPIAAPEAMNLAGVGADWVPFTIVDAGGDSLAWARRAFADPATPYAALSELAAAIEPGAEGLLFLPFLGGERAFGRAHVRAELKGLSARHGKGHLVRAVMEGVCLASREAFGPLRAAAPPLTRLVASGGGARSPVWVQIKADMVGLPVAVPESTEAGLVGCAALAAIAAGLHASQAEASAAMVRFDRTVEPRAAAVAVYDRLAERFAEAHMDLIRQSG
jgi:xylulokinase